ncbi:MAG: hypothetical protein IPI22_06205 [Bacteroidetes bacterium]|nr:hypothetical protein [Bacteroidota bacterium]
MNDKIVVQTDIDDRIFVTGVNVKGCLDTISATVVVNPDAVLDAGDTQTIFLAKVLSCMRMAIVVSLPGVHHLA